MSLTPYEKEVVIQWNEETKSLSIFSASSSFNNKMTRLGYLPYKTVDDANFYSGIPSKYVTIRKPSTAKRKPMTEEHKVKLQQGRKKASE